jgi:hypothetical protein
MAVQIKKDRNMLFGAQCMVKGDLFVKQNTPQHVVPCFYEVQRRKENFGLSRYS